MLILAYCTIFCKLETCKHDEDQISPDFVNLFSMIGGSDHSFWNHILAIRLRKIFQWITFRKWPDQKILQG